MVQVLIIQYLHVSVNSPFNPNMKTNLVYCVLYSKVNQYFQ